MTEVITLALDDIEVVRITPTQDAGFNCVDPDPCDPVQRCCDCDAPDPCF